MTEILGYAASVLVAVSLMMSGIVKLRIFNLIGALMMTAYGLLIDAAPVTAVNGFIALIDLYYLWDIFKAKEYFRTLEVHHDSEYLHYFIDFHQADIRKFMPAFTFQPHEDLTVFFILRNSIPAGLILAERRKDNSLFVELDYVIPGHRDRKIAKYVYRHIFADTHVEKIYTHPGNAKHDNYLRKMGFISTELEGKPVFCLSFE